MAPCMHVNKIYIDLSALLLFPVAFDCLHSKRAITNMVHFLNSSEAFHLLRLFLFNL